MENSNPSKIEILDSESIRRKGYYLQKWNTIYTKILPKSDTRTLSTFRENRDLKQKPEKQISRG